MGLEMRDTAVMIVHGIQGSPRLFDWIAEGLAGQVEVYNLLLPGHGGMVLDFCRSGMGEWKDFVEKRALELRKKHGRLIYVGHSMGCLLGLEAALKYPGLFDCMFFLGCPLQIRFTWRYAKYGFLAACPWETEDPYVLAARLGNSVHAKTPMAYLLAAPQFLQLFLEIGSLKRRLRDIGVPVYVWQMEDDEIVSPGALDALDCIKMLRTEILPGCGHNYFTDAAKERVLQEIESYL